MREPISRRDFLKTSATGMVAGSAVIANALDVRDFNAVGDGKTDDTAAVQRALNKAARTKSTVFIPDGVFVCSTLKMPPFVGLCGNPTWSYNAYAGSVLRLGEASVPCLIDITGAYGFRINGLCLDGAGLGKGIHGIMLDKLDQGKHEDTICIERCRIGNFTGDGLHLSRVWVFSIRQCMVCSNVANGLWYHGCDGFLMDNWFSNNGEAGVGSYEENSSVTFTGNRIEWNNRYGVILKSGSHFNFTGNYFDRTSGPSLVLYRNQLTTVTGNIFYRSGAPHGGAFSDQYQSAHLRFEEVEGLTCVGNTCLAGMDDDSKGETTPQYAAVVRALTNSVIANNVMHDGALKELIVDLGGHGPGFILKDNPGRILKSPV